MTDPLGRPECDGCSGVVRCRRGRRFGDAGEDYCRACLHGLQVMADG